MGTTGIQTETIRNGMGTLVIDWDYQEWSGDVRYEMLK